MLQNQYFEIMEDIIRNDKSDKPKGNTPQRQVRKPATGSTRLASSTTKPVPAKITAARKTTAPKPSVAGVTPPKAAKPAAKPAAQSQGSNISVGPAKSAAKTAPGVSAPVADKKSKKLAKDFKKLKLQKRVIASLEKNRDRLMKDLISAIDSKKKGKKIRSLARDFNRIEKRVKNRTASHIQAKKKLTKKMK